jgi:epoxide hydrolase 4
MMAIGRRLETQPGYSIRADGRKGVRSSQVVQRWKCARDLSKLQLGEAGMRHETLKLNGIDLHVRSMGAAQAPLILFLHGFPEYSGAWDEVLPAFAATFHAVAPDQRGYARSSKPEGLEAYRIKPLVRDILALGDRLSPERPFVVVAHDWGASVGYATAIAAPNRVAKLVVINGVHPGPFQRALIQEDAQRRASAYFHYLRAPEAEARLSANNFEKLLGMLSRFGPQPWLTPQKRAGYLEAWGQPGALTGMLNWYRATPIVVPKEGERVDPGLVPKLYPAQLRVRMPHLVIWGMNDQALLPATRATLADYCDNLTVREIAGADHWVVHQKTDEVIRLIRGFLGA